MTKKSKCLMVLCSTDGNTFTTVAYGTFVNDANYHNVIIVPTTARYVRVIATTEAGGNGPWTSMAEFNVNTADQAAPPNPAGKGSWGPTINYPLVPVSLANTYNGKVLAWSSYDPSTFGGSSGTQTITALYDPGTQVVTRALITNTNHDMFCEGLSMGFDGKYISAGGNTASAVSIYDSGANGWTTGPVSPLSLPCLNATNTDRQALKIARGYQSQLVVSTGKTFTIGASWSGGQGGKNGEIYDPATNTWTLLPGTPVAPLLTADAQGKLTQTLQSL